MKKIIAVLFALFTLTVLSCTAFAYDTEETYDLGPAIWSDGYYYYTSDGDCWPVIEEEIVIEEPVYDIGPAIWFDFTTGLYHTSDGLCWDEQGNFVVEIQAPFAYNHSTAISTSVSAPFAYNHSTYIDDLGPAIMYDAATGITHTSDGMHWDESGNIISIICPFETIA